MKTYSAQSGYVYQYYYEGHRPYRSGGAGGTEFVFSVSPDGKTWHATRVTVSDAAIRAWESAHERALASNEQYAIAKMALFQAFDERTPPPKMRDDVPVRPADVESIIEILGLG